MTPSELSARLSSNAEAVCRHLLPNGRRVRNEWVAGDAFGAAGDSFKVVIEGDKVGVGKDFAGQEACGDLLDLWCITQNVALGVAMAQASSFMHIVPDGEGTRPKREFQRPARPKAVRRLAKEGSVASYLRSRGMTDEVLEDFRISEMQRNDGAWIVFPYLRDGVHINTKYIKLERTDGKKKCEQEKNAEPCLFGWDALNKRFPNERRVVLTEGECFPGETEILTDEGWIRLDRYQDGRVAQWDHGVISFVYPLARIEKEYSGDLVRYEQRGYLSITTPNHNMIAISKSGEYYKHKAIEGSSSIADKIPRCGVCDGEGIELTYEQIALCVAVSADAAIDVRKLSYAGGPPRKLPVESRYARFGFKKQRKVDRLRLILNECGIIASDTEIAKGYRSICFGLPDWVPGRILPNEWIAQATLEQREFILDELIHWDGNSVPNRTMTEYSSKYKENVDFVQALCFTSGRCSSIISRKNSFGEWYKASILNGKTTSSWQQLKEKRKLIHHDGRVYCVQVPSGAILIRQEDKVSVSGNCDAMTYHQCGIPALSVPNGGGGGAKQDWIFSDYDRLSRFDHIYLSMDNDPVGREATAEIIKRLGSERCRIVELPYKDANECFSHGIKDFRKYLLSSRVLDPDELKPAGFFKSKVLDRFYPKPGAYRGMKTPWPGLTSHLMFRKPEFILWYGYDGCGKSVLLNHVMLQGLKDGEKFCVASMEMPADVTLWRLVRQISGEELPTREQADAIIDWLDDKLWIFNLVGSAKSDRLLEVFRYAKCRYDIRNFIIDSLTKIDIREDDYSGQKKFAVDCVDFSHKYETTMHLIAHTRKGESEELPPNKFDIRGAAGLSNVASTVISVWRYKEPKLIGKAKETPKEHPDTVITVEKQRETGWLGRFSLYFEPKSMQFHEQPTTIGTNHFVFDTTDTF